MTPEQRAERTFDGADNDWVVPRDGLVVGRVYFDISQNEFRAKRWFWSVITMPAQIGYVEAMAEGLEQVRSLATHSWSHKPHRWPVKDRS